MTLAEVKALCHQSDPAKSSNGKISMWLQPTAYDRAEFARRGIALESSVKMVPVQPR